MLGKLHITAIIIVAVCTALALLFFSRRTERTKNAVRLAVPLILIALEIWKDSLLAIEHEMSTGYLPLHLCSLGIPVFLAYSVCKLKESKKRTAAGHNKSADIDNKGSYKDNKSADTDNKDSHITENISRWTVFWGQTAVSLFFPGAVCGLVFADWTTLYPMWNFYNLHSYVWHGMLLFFPLFIMINDDMWPDIRKIGYPAAFLTAAAFIIYFIDKALDCNYLFINWPLENTPIWPIYEYMGAFWRVGYAILAAIVIILYDLVMMLIRKVVK